MGRAKGMNATMTTGADGFESVLGARRGPSAAMAAQRRRDDELASAPRAFMRADGTEEWYRHGKLHRDGGPAVLRSDGSEEWYRDGKRHREGGPAVLLANGTEGWYRKGYCHREGGPAILLADGTQEWRREGRLHREDGPALLRANGTEQWFSDGRPHDGPVVLRADSTSARPRGNCNDVLDVSVDVDEHHGL